MFAQFKSSLTTLSTSELRKYLDTLNDELFRRLDAEDSVPSSPTVPEIPVVPLLTRDKNGGFLLAKRNVKQPSDIVTVLPWTTRSHPSFNQIKKVLDQYQPVGISKRQMIDHIKVILAFVECAQGAERKAYIIRHMFRLLAVNVWFMNQHQNFRETVKNKIIEFETDIKKEANAVAREFAWMKEYPYPEHKCSYCSETGPWTEFDGSDYFCSQDHSKTFALNGDCVHNPDITKEELDHELEEYMAQHPSGPAAHDLRERPIESLVVVHDEKHEKIVHHDTPQVPTPGYRKVPDYEETTPADVHRPDDLIRAVNTPLPDTDSDSDGEYKPVYWHYRGKHQEQYHLFRAELETRCGTVASDEDALFAAATKAYHLHFGNGEDMNTFRSLSGPMMQRLSTADNEFLSEFNPEQDYEWDQMLDSVLERLIDRRAKTSVSDSEAEVSTLPSRPNIQKAIDDFEILADHPQT